MEFTLIMGDGDAGHKLESRVHSVFAYTSGDTPVEIVRLRSIVNVFFSHEVSKMADTAKNPFDLLIDQIRVVVREEIAAASSNGTKELLEPDELAARLKVPVSWVYEQSRQNQIPTHRIGRYIRFDLAEVLESQKKKESILPLQRVK
jgi:excisionase family DNA binding protein